MKKFDYFFSSLLITLTLFFALCAFLVAEYNSAKYIPADTPRLIKVSLNEHSSGEITLLGKQKKWDYSHLKDDITYIKRFLTPIPRSFRITFNTAVLGYEVAKEIFSSVTVGDETPSPPR